MSRRLYFVLPDVETSRKVVQELLLARVEEKRLHFLGKRGIDMKDLPEASAIHKTDLFRGTYIGLFAGTVTGLLAGLYIFFNPAGFGMQAPPYVIFVCAITGALVGAWISGPLIGASRPNQRLRLYSPLLEDGYILLLIDLPASRVEEVRKIIKGIYPKADDLVAEAGLPAIQ
jgi:hypothetical protein